MDASDRGDLIRRLADLIERDRVYLAVSIVYLYTSVFTGLFPFLYANLESGNFG